MDATIRLTMPGSLAAFVERQSVAQGADAREQIRQQVLQTRELAREAREAARQQARDAAQQARDVAQQAREATRAVNGMQGPLPQIPDIPRPIIVQPAWRYHEPTIPPQAVDLAMGFFVMVAVIAIGWPLARAFGRRIERAPTGNAIPSEVTMQLQRIERAVDAMSLEVERISESQRYMIRVQGDQSAERMALPRGQTS